MKLQLQKDYTGSVEEIENAPSAKMERFQISLDRHIPWKDQPIQINNLAVMQGEHVSYST